MGEMELSVKLQLANEQFVSALSAAVGDFRTAMDALKTSGVSAGNSIDDAFKNLGIRSGATIKAEVDKIRTSFATLKNSDLGFADKERASLALNTRLRELGRELGTVSSQNRSVQASAAGTAAGLNTLSGSVGDVAHRMLLWAGGITALQQGLSSIIATGSEFEQLGVRMKTVMGGVEQGEKAFAWIKQFAIDTPFQLTEVSQAFIKLKSFGIDPMNGSMQAITDQSAALGGGMETLNGITLALGQAWAKSKLQGQEILQLVERGVPVWDLLSKATGKSTAELVKMSEAGDIGREVIAQLIAEMGKANSGAAADMMDTFAGALSNAKDALAAFFNQIAESGALDYLKTRLQELVAEMDRLKQNGELAARAREMSDAIIAVAKAVEAAARFVVMFREEIATLIALNAASKFTGMLAGFAQTGAAAKKSATEVKGLGNQLLMLPSRLIIPIAIVVTGIELYQKVTGFIDEIIEGQRKIEEAGRAAVSPVDGQYLVRAREARDALEEINKKYFAGSDQSAMATGKIIGDFRKLTVEAKGTGQALDEMVKKVNFSDSASIDKMLASMDTLKRAGLVTGEEIRNSIGGALAKLSTKDFVEFQNAAIRAFDGSAEGARKLGIALEASLAEGFRRLRGDLEKFRTGLDQITRDAIEAFSAVAENARASGAEIGEAFKLALKTADTRQEVDALGASLKNAAADGVIAGKTLEDAQTRLAAKVRETAGEVEGALGDAFKRAGIKSRAELNAIAEQAKADFEAIKQSGQATEEGIGAAEKKYQDAEKAAKGAKEETKAIADEAGHAAEKTGELADAATEVTASMNDAGSGAGSAIAFINDYMDGAKAIYTQLGKTKLEIDGIFKQSIDRAMSWERAFKNAIEIYQTAVDLLEQAESRIASATEKTRLLSAQANDVTRNFNAAVEAANDLALGINRAANSGARMLTGIKEVDEALIKQYEAAEALAAAYRSIERSARSAAKSASDSVQGFLSSTRSIHEELLIAQGKEDEAAQSRMESRKRDLKLQYAQLQIQIKIAEVQAAAAGLKDTGLEQAAAEAAAAYSQAMKDLDALAELDKKKRRDEKSAAEKAAQEAAAKIAADQLIERAKISNGNGDQAAAASAAAAAAAAGSPTTNNNILNVTVNGEDLLSEDQIRRKIVPVLDKLNNRGR